MTRGFGRTHVRYDHAHRARDLHVCCPKCGARALATKESEASLPAHIMDLSGTWDLDDWTIRCESCMYRAADRSYADLPALYYRVPVRGTELWAWNRDHLQMLHRLLLGEDVSNHPYGFFATYAHGDWLRHREALSKAVGAVLQKG